MPKNDRTADRPLDGGLDGPADEASGEETAAVRPDGAADSRLITASTGTFTPAGDINSYIIEMTMQLANLAKEIGNDALATNLLKAVQAASRSNKEPRHFL